MIKTSHRPSVATRAASVRALRVSGLSVAAALLAGTALAPAQAQLWTGATSVDVTVATNYVGNTNPANGDVVFFNGALANQPVLALGDALTVNTAVVVGGILTINGALTATNGVTVAEPGALEIAATGSIIGDLLYSSPEIGTNNGTINGTLGVVGGVFANLGTVTGVTTLSGGVLEVSGGAVHNGNIVMNGGSLLGTGDVTLSPPQLGLLAGSDSRIGAAAGTTLLLTPTTYQRAPNSILRIGSADNSGTVAIGAGSVTTAAGAGTGPRVVIEGGTLQYNNATSATNFLFYNTGTTASTTIDAGASLDLAGFTANVTNLGGAGTVTNSNAGNATLRFRNSAASTFSGSIEDGAGTVSVEKLGTGTTLTLSGNSSFSGGLTISAGTVAVTQGAALGTGDVSMTALGLLRFDDSTTVTNNIGAALLVRVNTNGNDVVLQGSLSGLTGLKQGGGRLTLENATNGVGLLTVSAGELNVLGGVQGALLLSAGSLLSGDGTVSGLVTGVGSAAIAPGAAAGEIGTLSVGSLALVGGTQLNFDLGPIGLIGGTDNDLIEVGGGLVLDGTLNVTSTAGFNTGVGAYRLINYGGGLTNLGVDLGAGLLAPPTGVSYAIDTTVLGQVNLLVSYAGLYYWDGAGTAADGIITGGAGTWTDADVNWTNSDGTFNLAWAPAGATAVFATEGGAVQVDGAKSVEGLNFEVDGYELSGDTLNLAGAGPNEILVATDATATINNVVAGANGLTKTGSGTLVLNGENMYAGGTLLSAGTVRAGSDTALGAGSLSMSDGTVLALDTVSLANDVAITGTGTVDLLLGDSTLSGAISGGALVVGSSDGTATVETAGLTL
ncbi:beta strand repeat-containing protein, partial [Polymorphobacter sp.]|uniref:beta strand repeat-containing protein n=1 Tax=Polymorphobacter sp. TaxID=1909290 RepID=UPI003F70200C